MQKVKVSEYSKLSTLKILCSGRDPPPPGSRWSSSSVFQTLHMQKVKVSEYSKLSTPRYCERVQKQILPLLAHVGVVVQYARLCTCKRVNCWRILQTLHTQILFLGREPLPPGSRWSCSYLLQTIRSVLYYKIIKCYLKDYAPLFMFNTIKHPAFVQRNHSGWKINTETK